MGNRCDDPRSVGDPSAVYELAPMDPCDPIPNPHPPACRPMSASATSPPVGSIPIEPVGGSKADGLTPIERVVMLHDPQVRALIEDLVEALGRQRSDLSGLAALEQEEDCLRLLARADGILARD